MESKTQFPDTFTEVALDLRQNVLFLDSNSQLHNPYGPSVKFADGSEWYHIHGKRHRTDGPAIIHVSGLISYWVNGEPVDQKNFERLYGTRK